MADEGLDFDTVLKDAQDKGYAERNPEADVEGYDACRKIAILSSLAFGQQVDYEDIYTEGITKITAEDIKYAKAMGRSIKLLASSKKVDGKVYAMVAPGMVSTMHPLYSVSNVLGDVMFYGSGAGKLPTASAVVADAVDAAKHLHQNIITFWSSEKLALSDISTSKKRFFVRINGDLAKAKALFGNVTVVDVGIQGEVGFVTEVMSEADFAKVAESTQCIVNRIRMED